MKNKKKVILLVVSILGVVGIVFGLSYAWFTIVIQGQKVNTIKAGELTLSINETGDTLNITDAFPISEEEGLKGTATTFSLTNTSPKNLEYKLKLVYDETSCNNCKKIPSSAVRYSLTKNGTTLDSANLGENNNVLESGIINAKGTYEYSLKIWIDYDAGNEAMDAYFYGKLEVEALQTNLAAETPESCFEFDSSTGTITRFICAPKIFDPAPTWAIPNTNSVNNIVDVVIPKTIGGIPVTKIGSDAFNDNQIMSVTIPSSVTAIENLAFYGNKLTSVTIPERVTSIKSQAFSSNQLTSVTIPDSVTDIDSYAFEKNQLTSIVIPESVKSISFGVFRNNQITSVTIPSSVTAIENQVFQDNQLTSVTIPDNVTSIGSWAFYGNKLTSVTIPESVTEIGLRAFYSNQLTSVIIKGKTNSSEFTKYGIDLGEKGPIWGWASGYSDDNITWNG